MIREIRVFFGVLIVCFVFGCATSTTIPENVVFRDGSYRPAQGYTWVNPNDQNNLRVMPKNVIYRDGSYHPAEGYTWVNPNDQSDLRVRRRSSFGKSQHSTYGTDTQSPNRNTDEYNRAYSEYERALQNYNQALRELDNASNLQSLNNMSFGTLMSGSKLDRAVGLINKGTSHLSVQEAERNVVIARERLNRAKARLDAMNWR